MCAGGTWGREYGVGDEILRLRFAQNDYGPVTEGDKNRCGLKGRVVPEPPLRIDNSVGFNCIGAVYLHNNDIWGSKNGVGAWVE